MESDAPSAADLTTKREVFRAFASRGSPRSLMATAVLLLGVRLSVGDWGSGDLIVLAVTLALAGTVEWVIHRFLLHAPPSSWRMRILGTGTGHREHHLDPTSIGWLLLRPGDAALFAGLFGLFSAGWVLALSAVGLVGFTTPFLTAWTLAVLGLAHYEWTHLLIHTRYRPSSRYYAGLARNHRLHHYRNERFWLGVTSNAGDRLLGTLPAAKGDVPLSDTAGTLQ